MSVTNSNNFFPPYRKRDRKFNKAWANQIVDRKGHASETIRNTPNPTLPFTVPNPTDKKVRTIFGERTVNEIEKALTEEKKTFPGKEPTSIYQLWLKQNAVVINQPIEKFEIAGSKALSSLHVEDVKAYFQHLKIDKFCTKHAIRRWYKPSKDIDPRTTFVRKDSDTIESVEEAHRACLRHLADIKGVKYEADYSTEQLRHLLGIRKVEAYGDYFSVPLPGCDVSTGFFKAFCLFGDSNVHIVIVPTSVDGDISHLQMHIETDGNTVNFVQALISKGLGFIDPIKPEEKDYRACFDELLKNTQGEVCQIPEAYPIYLNTFLRHCEQNNWQPERIAGLLENIVTAHSDDIQKAKMAVLLNFEWLLHLGDPELSRRFTPEFLQQIWLHAFPLQKEAFNSDNTINPNWVEDQITNNPILILKQLFQVPSELIGSALFTGGTLANSIPALGRTIQGRYDAAITRHLDRPMLEVIHPFDTPQPKLEKIQEGHSLFLDFDPVRWAEAIEKHHLPYHRPDVTRALTEIFQNNCKAFLQQLHDSPIQEQKEFLQKNEKQLLRFIETFLLYDDQFLILAATSFAAMLTAMGSDKGKEILFRSCISALNESDPLLANQISGKILGYLAPEHRKSALVNDFISLEDDDFTGWISILLQTEDATLSALAQELFNGSIASLDESPQALVEILTNVEKIAKIGTEKAYEIVIPLLERLEDSHITKNHRLKLEEIIKAVKKGIKDNTHLQSKRSALRYMKFHSQITSLVIDLKIDQTAPLPDSLSKDYDGKLLKDTSQLLFELLNSPSKLRSYHIEKIRKIILKMAMYGYHTYEETILCLATPSASHVLGREAWLKCLDECLKKTHPQKITTLLAKYPKIITTFFSHLKLNDSTTTSIARLLHKNEILRQLFPKTEDYWRYFRALIPFLEDQKREFWSAQLKKIITHRTSHNTQRYIEIYVQPFKYIEWAINGDVQLNSEERTIFLETLLTQYPRNDQWPRQMAHCILSTFSHHKEPARAIVQATLLLEQLLNQLPQENRLGITNERLSQIWQALPHELVNNDLIYLLRTGQVSANFIEALMGIAGILGLRIPAEQSSSALLSGDQTDVLISHNGIHGRIALDLLGFLDRVKNYASQPQLVESHLSTLAIHLFSELCPAEKWQKTCSPVEINDGLSWDENNTIRSSACELFLSPDPLLQLLGTALLISVVDINIPLDEELLFTFVLPNLANSSHPALHQYGLAIAKHIFTYLSPERAHDIERLFNRNSLDEFDWIQLLALTGKPVFCAFAVKHWRANIHLTEKNFTKLLPLLKALWQSSPQNALQLLDDMLIRPLPIGKKYAKHIVDMSIGHLQSLDNLAGLNVAPLVDWCNALVEQKNAIEELPNLAWLYAKIKAEQPQLLQQCASWLPFAAHTDLAVLKETPINVAYAMARRTSTAKDARQLFQYIQGCLHLPEAFPLLCSAELKKAFENTDYLKKLSLVYIKHSNTTTQHSAKMAIHWLKNTAQHTAQAMEVTQEDLLSVLDRLLAENPLPLPLIITFLSHCHPHPLFADNKTLLERITACISLICEKRLPSGALLAQHLIENNLLSTLSKEESHRPKLMNFLRILIDTVDKTSLECASKLAETLKDEEPENLESWNTLLNSLRNCAAKERNILVLQRLEAIAKAKESLRSIHIQINLDLLNESVQSDPLAAVPLMLTVLSHQEYFSEDQKALFKTLLKTIFDLQLLKDTKSLSEQLMLPAVQKLFSEEEWNSYATQLEQKEHNASIFSELIFRLNAGQVSESLSTFADYLLHQPTLSNGCITASHRWDRLKTIFDYISEKNYPTWKQQAGKIAKELYDEKIYEGFLEITLHGQFEAACPAEIAILFSKAIDGYCENKDSLLTDNIVAVSERFGNYFSLSTWDNLGKLAETQANKENALALCSAFQKHNPIAKEAKTEVEKAVHTRFLKATITHQGSKDYYLKDIPFASTLLASQKNDAAMAFGKELMVHLLNNCTLPADSDKIISLRQVISPTGNSGLDLQIASLAIQAKDEKLLSAISNYLETLPEQLDTESLSKLKQLLDTNGQWHSFPNALPSLQNLLPVCIRVLPSESSSWPKVLQNHGAYFATTERSQLISPLLPHLAHNISKAKRSEYQELLSSPQAVQCITAYIENMEIRDDTLKVVKKFLNELSSQKLCNEAVLANYWGLLTERYLEKCKAEEPSKATLKNALDMFCLGYPYFYSNIQYERKCAEHALEMLFSLLKQGHDDLFAQYSAILFNQTLYSPTKKVPPRFEINENSEVTLHSSKTVPSSSPHFQYYRDSYLQRIAQLPKNDRTLPVLNVQYAVITTLVEDSRSNSIYDPHTVVQHIKKYILQSHNLRAESYSSNTQKMSILLSKAISNKAFEKDMPLLETLNFYLNGPRLDIPNEKACAFVISVLNLISTEEPNLLPFYLTDLAQLLKVKKISGGDIQQEAALYLHYIDLINLLPDKSHYESLLQLLIDLGEHSFSTNPKTDEEKLKVLQVHYEAFKGVSDLAVNVFRSSYHNDSPFSFAHFQNEITLYFDKLCQKEIFRVETNEAVAAMWEMYLSFADTVCQNYRNFAVYSTTDGYSFSKSMLRACLPKQEPVQSPSIIEKRKLIFKAFRSILESDLDSVSIHKIYEIVKENPKILDSPALFFCELPKSLHLAIPAIFAKPDELENVLNREYEQAKKLLEMSNSNIACQPELITQNHICMLLLNHGNEKELDYQTDVEARISDLVYNTIIHLRQRNQSDEAALLLTKALKYEIFDSEEMNTHLLIVDLLQPETNLEQSTRVKLFRRASMDYWLSNETLREQKLFIISRNLSKIIPHADQQDWKITLTEYLNSLWHTDIERTFYYWPLISLLHPAQQENLWLNAAQATIQSQNPLYALEVFINTPNEIISKHPAIFVQCVALFLNSKTLSPQDLTAFDRLFSVNKIALLPQSDAFDLPHLIYKVLKIYGEKICEQTETCKSMLKIYFGSLTLENSLEKVQKRIKNISPALCNFDTLPLPEIRALPPAIYDEVLSNAINSVCVEGDDTPMDSFLEAGLVTAETLQKYIDKVIALAIENKQWFVITTLVTINDYKSPLVDTQLIKTILDDDLNIDDWMDVLKLIKHLKFYDKETLEHILQAYKDCPMELENLPLYLSILTEMEKVEPKHAPKLHRDCWLLALELAKTAPLAEENETIYDFSILRNPAHLLHINKAFENQEERAYFLTLYYRAIVSGEISDASANYLLKLRSQIHPSTIANLQLLEQVDGTFQDWFSNETILLDTTYFTALTSFNTMISRKQPLENSLKTLMNAVLIETLCEIDRRMLPEAVAICKNALKSFPPREMDRELVICITLCRSSHADLAAIGTSKLNDLWKAFCNAPSEVQQKWQNVFRNALKELSERHSLHCSKDISNFFLTIIHDKKFNAIFDQQLARRLWFRTVQKEINTVCGIQQAIKPYCEVLKWMQHYMPKNQSTSSTRNLVNLLSVALFHIAVNENNKEHVRRLIQPSLDVFNQKLLRGSTKKEQTSLAHTYWSENPYHAFLVAMIENNICYTGTKDEKAVNGALNWLMTLAKQVFVASPSETSAKVLTKLLLNPLAVNDLFDTEYLPAFQRLYNSKEMEKLKTFPKEIAYLTLLKTNGKTTLEGLNDQEKIACVLQIATEWLKKPSWTVLNRLCDIIDNFQGINLLFVTEQQEVNQLVEMLITAGESCIQNQSTYPIGTLSKMLSFIQSTPLTYEQLQRTFKIAHQFYENIPDNSNEELTQILDEIALPLLELISKVMVRGAYDEDEEIDEEELYSLYLALHSHIIKAINEASIPVEIEHLIKSATYSLANASKSNKVSKNIQKQLLGSLRCMLNDISNLSPSMAARILNWTATDPLMREVL